MRVFLALVCIAVSAGCSSLSNTTSRICKELQKVVGDALTLPGNVDYDSLREANWVETAWGTPGCILEPLSVSQLQKAVPLLVKGNASFAIRSGGHSPNHGFANIDGGVLIGMSNFSRLQYNPTAGTAVVGAGLRWGEVYSGLGQFNVTAVGGRVLDVGVGGLILGCGLSWFTDLYGQPCDNVVNFQVVLANGSVVDANAEVNQDLFWALKGGGNNFGIITEYTLKTYAFSGQVWGGIRYYNISQLPEVMAAYYQYQSNPDKSPWANLIVAAVPTNASIGLLASMVYLKPEEVPAREAFAPFLSINSNYDTTAITSYTDYMDAYPIPDIPRFNWLTTSVQMDQPTYDTIAGVILNSTATAALGAVTDGLLVLTFQPVSAETVHIGQQQGNTLGLSPVKQTWLTVNSGWWFAEDDEVVHTAARKLWSDISCAATERNTSLPYIFMNDASWEQDVMSGYGQCNLAKMKDVQARYDPQSVFQKLVPGGFKLV